MPSANAVLRFIHDNSDLPSPEKVVQAVEGMWPSLEGYLQVQTLWNGDKRVTLKPGAPRHRLKGSPRAACSRRGLGIVTAFGRLLRGRGTVRDDARHAGVPSGRRVEVLAIHE